MLLGQRPPDARTGTGDGGNPAFEVLHSWMLLRKRRRRRQPSRRVPRRHVGRLRARGLGRDLPRAAGAVAALLLIPGLPIIAALVVLVLAALGLGVGEDGLADLEPPVVLFAALRGPERDAVALGLAGTVALTLPAAVAVGLAGVEVGVAGVLSSSIAASTTAEAYGGEDDAQRRAETAWLKAPKAGLGLPFTSSRPV